MLILKLFLIANIIYGSPVNYKISLAGTFGEPRPYHFHGGADIKTDRKEGKPIFSIGDGYISHVTIGIGGYGNAVYVHHPEGYTSVYAHLQRFMPQVATMVKKWQWEHGCKEGEIRFRPTDFPVAKGQLLAFSGNTGASQAPHLHLEIHETQTWKMMDPLDYIGDFIHDNTPPTAHALMAYPQKGEGVVNGSVEDQYFNFSNDALNDTLTVWGKVGFGIWANDYMEESTNNFGIRYTDLYVDGHRLFHSDVNGIDMDDNLQVHAWGDYSHYRKSHVWYMKSFLSPGVTLPILFADDQRGIVCFDEERDYHFIYILADFKGNRREYPFTVKARHSAIPKPSYHPFHTLAWNRPNAYQLPGMQLYVPSRRLVGNVELRPQVYIQRGKYSDAYRLTSDAVAVIAPCTLSLRVKRQVKDPTKLYVVERSKRERRLKGRYENGWLTVAIRDLDATYEVGYGDDDYKESPIIL
ncbi:MAG: M23 family metallopeptidase [Prevotella sp.]|nr:M23 family metallopeptidase [Prevotella sp.]